PSHRGELSLRDPLRRSVSTSILFSALVRWLDFAAFAALAGAASLDLVVLPRGPAELELPRRALRRLSLMAAAALLLTSAAPPALRAVTLAGGGIGRWRPRSRACSRGPTSGASGCCGPPRSPCCGGFCARGTGSGPRRRRFRSPPWLSRPA